MDYHRIFKWKKTYNVSFDCPSMDNPSEFFNRYIAPALVALDNQYEHEKKKAPNVVKVGGLQSVIGRVFDSPEKNETMVIYMEIGEVDKEVTNKRIKDFIKTI